MIGIDRKTFASIHIARPWHGRVRSNVGERNNFTSQTVLAWGTAVSVDRFASQDLLVPPRQRLPELRRRGPRGQPWDIAPEHQTHAQFAKLTFRGAQRVLFERVDQHGRCVDGRALQPGADHVGG